MKKIEDRQITELYWMRSETAIEETKKKYDPLLYRIAFNVLRCREDAEECASDAVLRAWNSIPPQKPEKLSAFLGKIARNLALDRLDKNSAKKRSVKMTAFDEFSQCIPDSAADAFDDAIALKDLLDRFLHSLPRETRVIFMKRYFYFYQIKEIARELGLGESKVKMTLARTREGLRDFLKKEGFDA